MNIEHGRPVITGQDHPSTVYKAVHESVKYPRLFIPHEPSLWRHKARNAYETLSDTFRIRGSEMDRPDNETILWDMNVDQLELAVVAYGCKQLDKNRGQLDNEMVAIDGVLRAIDNARSAN